MVARAPRKRMYRSMQGRMIDIEKLRTTNEDVRAVGNMNVNARGDVLGVGGKVATSKAQVIQKYYEAPKGRVDDTPTRARPVPVKKTPPAPQPVASKPTKVAPQVKKATPAKPAAKKTKKGIDAALDGIE
tara:strand:- start:510 stop:899 length:390 start_codon:yes stop_codon:yes gene_type:complete